MSVKIRLKRIGAKKRPFYRIVVANSTASRDGKFIATIGTYNPCDQPATVTLDTEKTLQWLGFGAKPTDTANALLRKHGILTQFEQAKAENRAALKEGVGK